MSKTSLATEPFEVDRAFEFVPEAEAAEQLEFDEWLRRIGGWVSGNTTEAATRSAVPQLARKGVGAAYRRIEPKVTKAAAPVPAKAGIPPEKVCWIQNVLNQAN